MNWQENFKRNLRSPFYGLVILVMVSCNILNGLRTNLLLAHLMLSIVMIPLGYMLWATLDTWGLFGWGKK